MSFVRAFDESMKDKYELILLSVSCCCCSGWWVVAPVCKPAGPLFVQLGQPLLLLADARHAKRNGKA
jgi:hypothetical protein